MNNKIKAGIIFGGQSKEREISFAGGRTVYDNLNKALFEPLPLFIDSFGNFIELQWQYIYKGAIRDFYPPIEFLPADSRFQLYAENLGQLNEEQQNLLIEKIGKKIPVDELKQKIDFAFLCLHGPYGEDGRIQGLLEYLQIPYSGSGVLPSSIGINKALQKELMINKGFNSPAYITINRRDWIDGKAKHVFETLKEKIGFPCVVKPANQGSSIGVTILTKESEFDFMAAVEKALFTRWLDAKEWRGFSAEEKIDYTKQLADIREGIGMPLLISHPAELNTPVIYSPDDFIKYVDENLKLHEGFVLESMDGENTVMVEGFIEGKEFSCIVLEDESGKAIALPPTEIRKGKELFDYRSKYLPGLSRKITPIQLPDEQIENILRECERLFYELHFDVYARIDGFITKDGKIFLNDPNTTSGMMPSSFFFHQAAEIGLNPSQFLTFIIRTSLQKRFLNSGILEYKNLLNELDEKILNDKKASAAKTRVAVVLGGYSSERHISVESGRNVFEKLSSSEKYSPFPVFLTGNNSHHEMYRIPINLMLKDNADDIKEKAEKYEVHDVVKKIMKLCDAITKKYASFNLVSVPQKIDYLELKNLSDEVFIALHGRPGEDGAFQEKLDALGLPYNGSSKESSNITIDKYRTNEILRQNGMNVAAHVLITKEEWQNNKEKFSEILKTQIKYPFIAKPVDDGCSSAVKKIKSLEEFEAFCKLMFRSEEELDTSAAEKLHIKPKEEFPIKTVVLVEELISKKNAKHFLEVTGGMLTHISTKGELKYEVFEASEALADGEVLSLEEKFLAGQGQNITPARYAKNKADRDKISEQVKTELGKAARLLGVTGYCRIDAFVRVYDNCRTEVIFIEVNSLPGMTPATCIFHQAAINNYKPYEFINEILEFGKSRAAIVVH